MSSTGGGSAAAAAGTSSPTITPRTFRSEVTAIWEMDAKQLENWFRLMSQTLTPSALLELQVFASAIPNREQLSERMISKLQQQQHEFIHMAMYKNVKTAMEALKMTPLIPPKKEGEEEEEQEPNAKRHKGPQGKKSKKNGKVPAKKQEIKYKRHDPYNIWLHVPLPKKEDEEDEDADDTMDGNNNIDDYELGEDEDLFPEKLGGRLSQLGVAGFVNALALVLHGHVDNKNVAEPKDEASKKKILLQFTMPSTGSSPAATLQLSALQIHRLAVTWHRIIQAEVRKDILKTTPLRIQDMLAADLSAREFASIRQRITDTVVHGRGIHVNDKDLNVDETLATANTSSGPVMEIEKYKKCPTCGNNDQASFVMDRKNGDVICSNCGTVVSESLMHEGSQYRKFEGEADRNHHGDAANPLYSNAHNMSTTLSGVTQVSGAGIGGWRSGERGGGRNLETILRNAHDYIELNVSQLGKTDRRTRTGYKDRQKKEAFVQMGHVGDALSLHEAVVQRAKELFAGFRDDRELVQQFKGVIAACLCEAFEQLSTAGLNILKQDDLEQPEQTSSSSANMSNVSTEPGTTGYSARAARRNELHHAKLAGKGGLLLDWSDVATTDKKKATTGGNSNGAKSESNSPTAATAVQNALEEAPAATWDLEHCRSWLLEASRRIAQQWVDERAKGTAASKRIPSGTLEELEGSLVEHSFTLCEQLEAELQARGGKQAAAKVVNGRRVTTPRINDMSKIGIRWQHSHERGSGGKGGVGGSGTGSATKSAGRTAGQALILKTAKKLGSMLNDPVAGDAIHKELRAVVAKQEARKLKDRREEASRQRMQQMKRKPWLQARVQAET